MNNKLPATMTPVHSRRDEYSHFKTLSMDKHKREGHQQSSPPRSTELSPGAALVDVQKYSLQNHLKKGEDETCHNSGSDRNIS